LNRMMMMCCRMLDRKRSRDYGRDDSDDEFEFEENDKFWNCCNRSRSYPNTQPLFLFALGNALETKPGRRPLLWGK
jgi:hypothetical protein